jgi:hypothetical protein
MREFIRVKSVLAAVLILFGCLATVVGQEQAGELRGQIKDDFGSAIVGAEVTLDRDHVRIKSGQTDQQGYYGFRDLPAGTYQLAARSEGFAPYEDPAVIISAGRLQQLNFKLEIATMTASVTVGERSSSVGVDPENDGGTLVIKGADLDTLPDDPDELATSLQVMAGSVGTAGTEQFYLDGFQANRLPAKRNIREVRINQNPFAAEFDHLGTNRIDILTKPGTGKFFGQTFFTFGDGRLNARDPFAAERAPFQSRVVSGTLSGPIVKQSSSFFLDFEHRAIDENGTIRATVLDPFLNITSLNESVLTPQSRTLFSLRLDQKLNNTNTLVARIYSFRQDASNSGAGGFALPSRAFDASEREQTLQLTETAVLGKSAVSETRFQFVRERFVQQGDNSRPTINVLDAFVDGPIGEHSFTQNLWELSQQVSWAHSKHNLKGGVQLRRVSVNDLSRRNFGGTFTFAGGTAVRLDENGQVVYGLGLPEFVSLTSIERYRRTLLFATQGLPANSGSLSPSDLGFGPTQLSMTVGSPAARVSQLSFAAFVQDDWRVSPNFTLSAGLRYELQSNVGKNLDLAPRLRFAWAPGGPKNGQRGTIIRGGIGIFYDRIAEDLTLQANRFNGVTQRQLIIRDPEILQSFPSLPDLAASATLIPYNIIRVANDARAPYSLQTALGIDHQLSPKLTISVTYLYSRALHLLRSRDINAPLTGTNQATTAVRPLGEPNNVFLYESSGRSNQQQLFIRFNGRLTRKANFFGTYILNQAKSDTDGPSNFPANSYDLSTEYGRSLMDVRHYLVVGGTIDLRWGLRLNPLVVASSGRPFNIITGRDTNGDSLFTERPAFATDLMKPGVVVTPFGAFDPNPSVGEPLIPRNFGVGPTQFVVNLRIGKTFQFGKGRSSTSGNAAPKRKAGDTVDNAWGGAAPSAANASDGRYSLSLALRLQNLFNHVNAATPVGNLGSLLFGQSTSSAGSFGLSGNPGAGNRRVEMQIGFTF